MKVMKFKQGQIWWNQNCSTYDNTQGKSRPVIIVSNDKANQYSTNVTVVPCTTKVKNMYLPTHVKFKLNDIENIALCENILTISKSKLTTFEGICDNELLGKIKEALKIALGFIEISEDDYTSESEPSTDIQVTNNLDSPKKLKYSLEYMNKYIDDYVSNGIDYIVDKYNEVSTKSAYSKIYRFRKFIKSEE